jgi:hypothetical protein
MSLTLFELDKARSIKNMSGCSSLVMILSAQSMTSPFVKSPLASPARIRCSVCNMSLGFVNGMKRLTGCLQRTGLGEVREFCVPSSPANRC